MTKPKRRPKTDPIKALPPLRERVKSALAYGYVEMQALEEILYPPELFPKAHRAAVQGGPPGIRWMLTSWLRRNSVPISAQRSGATSLVGPYPGERVPVATICSVSEYEKARAIAALGNGRKRK